jgi:type III pantothenate kinase
VRFGLFEDDQCTTSWIINTKPYRTRDEFFVQFKILYQTYNVDVTKVDKIIIGSVVPQLTHDISSALYKIHGLEAVIVDRKTHSPVHHKSNQMGTDIYANLVAAHFLYPDKKKIILDFGTALTASCIDKDGEVLGVIIAPGIITSLNSLVKQTAQLPEIELTKPKSVLGHDTVSCMTSGMVYGFLGMVEGFIDRINEEVKDNCFVIATGGVSHVYQPLTNKIDVADKLHTLKGLYFLGKDK